MANNGTFGPTLTPAAPVTGAPMATGMPTMPNLGGMTQQAPPPVQSNVKYVHNMQEVLNDPATPNEHRWYPEIDNNVIWIRETDAKGQIKNPLMKITYADAEEVPFGPEANFVTKQEHQKLYDLVSNMNETLNKLMKEWGGTT